MKLIFCDTGGDLAKALDCAKSMKTQGVQGILQFQHDTKASPSICKAGPAGRARVRDRHPAAALPDLVHGRRQRLRRLRGRREGRRDGKAQWNCKYDAWISLEQPEIGAPNDQRMGGYRKGFQSVCPGPITNLKKVGFDATARQGADARDRPRSRPCRASSTSSSRRSTTRASRARSPPRSPQAAPKDVWGISLGVADKVAKCGIKTNPNWLAATAIFPEKYGWTGDPVPDQGDQGREAAQVALRAADRRRQQEHQQVLPEPQLLTTSGAAEGIAAPPPPPHRPADDDGGTLRDA